MIYIIYPRSSHHPMDRILLIHASTWYNCQRQTEYFLFEAEICSFFISIFACLHCIVSSNDLRKHPYFPSYSRHIMNHAPVTIGDNSMRSNADGRATTNTGSESSEPDQNAPLKKSMDARIFSWKKQRCLCYFSARPHLPKL
jgi:hypothetical protein